MFTQKYAQLKVEGKILWSALEVHKNKRGIFIHI